MAYVGSSKAKLYIGAATVKNGYIGSTRFYSSGSSVTYIVDTSTSYTLSVDYGESVLSPTSFTPTKSGYTFVGWREDSTASSSVLSSKTMGDAAINLYAVFKRTITLTYYNNTTTKATTTGTQYYNNGNTSNPTFTLSQASKSGWTARGWSTGTAGNASVSYSSISGTAFSSDTTVYGLYYKTCVLTAKSYNSTQTVNGTAYYNSSGDTYNASATVPTGATYSGWTWRGWSTGTGAGTSVAYANGATIWYGTSDLTIYGLYQQTITLTYYNNSTTASTTTGTRYWNSAGNYTNPTFTLSQASKSGWTARGWSTATTGNASVTYSSISSTAFSENTTVYGLYYKTCVLTAKSYNSTQTVNGTAYYNSSGDTYNASATAPTGATYSGWTWRGWATGTDASTSIAYANGATIWYGTSDLTIYGCYYQTITCTFKSYNSSQTASGIRYYNAYGNTSNASVTVPTGATYSGWTWRGWSAAGTTTANATVTYANGATISGLTAGYTYYGLYYQTITLSYNGNGSTSGSTSSQTGTRYYNAYGNTSNPSFTLASNGFAKTNYTFSKWAQGSTSGTQYAAGASVTLSASTTFYAIWTAVAFYWFRHTDSGEEYTSGYPTSWTMVEECCGDEYIRNTLYSFYGNCTECGNFYWKSTASGSAKGNTKATIYVYEGKNMKLVANGTTLYDANVSGEYGGNGTYEVDISNDTLSMTLTVSGDGYCTINYIYFHS